LSRFMQTLPHNNSLIAQALDDYGWHEGSLSVSLSLCPPLSLSLALSLALIERESRRMRRRRRRSRAQMARRYKTPPHKCATAWLRCGRHRVFKCKCAYRIPQQ
jgi:hypothetical protein